MTYRELAEQISTMNESQLNMDVTVYVAGLDEYYPVMDDYSLSYVDSTTIDVLDHDHPYLVI